MKVKYIELEMNKDELKASTTLGEQANRFLTRLFMNMNGYSEEQDEEEEANGEDE